MHMMKAYFGSRLNVSAYDTASAYDAPYLQRCIRVKITVNISE